MRLLARPVEVKQPRRLCCLGFMIPPKVKSFSMVKISGRWNLRNALRELDFYSQEPFLFTGTVRDNILYGNSEFASYSNEQLEDVIRDADLKKLLSSFENGLDTNLGSAGESISLGQKQLIAFIRAVLRNPDLLILDEATANIDTITERVLQNILNKLPAYTTRVIIAHRLNTIQNADEIFFVNAGEVIRAGSFDHAVDMLMQGKRAS